MVPEQAMVYERREEKLRIARGGMRLKVARKGEISGPRQMSLCADVRSGQLNNHFKAARFLYRSISNE